MKIKTLSKTWSFLVDDEKWKVTYSFSSRYWHVSSQRKSEAQFKEEPQMGINKNKAIFYLSKVMEQKEEVTES